jgi:16S rRNA (cytosine1402-N4)-methyltransferase
MQFSTGMVQKRVLASSQNIKKRVVRVSKKRKKANKTKKSQASKIGNKENEEQKVNARAEEGKNEKVETLAAEDEQTLIHIFKTYGEEPEARRVAKAICAKRHEITDTTSLAKVVADSKRLRMPGRHPATLVFQALRMEVNSELANLRRGLEAACKLLATRGRLVVISFHSLEDRLVKHLLRGPAFPGVGRINQLNMEAVGNLVTPSEDEVAANPRARSARMRVFVKLAAL